VSGEDAICRHIFNNPKVIDLIRQLKILNSHFIPTDSLDDIKRVDNIKISVDQVSSNNELQKFYFTNIYQVSDM
jgi:hypothetical protein